MESRQRLDGDLPAESRVAGAVDLAHAARADQAVDFVGAEPCARQERFAHAAASLLRFPAAPTSSAQAVTAAPSPASAMNRFELTRELTDEQRTRLLQIAQRCPVHRTLVSEIDIRPPQT